MCKEEDRKGESCARDRTYAPFRLTNTEPPCPEIREKAQDILLNIIKIEAQVLLCALNNDTAPERSPSTGRSSPPGWSCTPAATIAGHRTSA